jgi:inositol transport system ATP-binding protein
MQHSIENIIELKKISKSFGGINVLDSVDMKIRRNTIHALVGENGAGKSTLMKILMGIEIADQGEIIFNGKRLTNLNPEKSLRIGISMIQQELSLQPYMNVAENIFIGEEPSYPGIFSSFIDYNKMHRDAAGLLGKLGIKCNLKTKTINLNISTRQLIEIAKALSRKASLIIMDEPTSSLTTDEAKILFEIIMELKKNNTTIVYISHKMDEIFKIADEITVLRDGKVIDSAPKETFTMNTLVKKMVGRELTKLFPKVKVNLGDIIFEAKNLTRKGVIYDINLNIRKGEILGIAGLIGAGRTEVARAIFGLDKLDYGEMYMNSKKITIRRPQDAISEGIALVPEDRKEEGLILCRSIKENCSLPSLNSSKRGLFFNLNREKEEAMKMVHSLHIKIPNLDVMTSHLSGGNQQKVVLAKWILVQPKLLILDEPTRGIDIGAKYEIYSIMCELARNGLSIIMISSELEEILGMSDRVIIMNSGRIIKELDVEETTQEIIMKYAV